MRLVKSLAAVLALATLSLAAAPALAAPTGAKGQVVADAGARGKKFPMAGAEFKQKVDQRIATARQKMETRIASLPADKQREVRDRFNAGVTAVNAEVAKAVADNVVTKDEAKKVRETARALRGGGGQHPHKHPKRA